MLRRAWTAGRLTGSLRFPENARLYSRAGIRNPLISGARWSLRRVDALSQTRRYAASRTDATVPTGLSSVAPAGWPERGAPHVLGSCCKGHTHHPASMAEAGMRAGMSAGANAHMPRIGIICSRNANPVAATITTIRFLHMENFLF